MRWMILILILASPALGQVKTSSFPARDTLDIPRDADAAAQAVLDGLAWTPASFTVRAGARVQGQRDAVVWFPSARPQGDARQDRVPIEWYAARNQRTGEAIDAPALVLVHSLHPAMPLATLTARTLSQQGIHVFIIHLPGYGLRSDGRATGVSTLIHGRQAVADVRRARDAVAALPHVRKGAIGVAGISLGGFAAAAAASLDGAFDPVILVLSGVDGYQVLCDGRYDAAAVRRSMATAGYAGDDLRTLIALADPMPLVHRLDPTRTWLFSARDDHVVPSACTDALTDRLPLDDDHHIWVAGTHYTAVFALPAVIHQMQHLILAPQIVTATHPQPARTAE